MAKKKKEKENLGSRYNKAPVQSIYSNTLGIGYSDTEVVINFGFSTPSYFEPNDDEDVPVARIVLSWEVANVLLESLQEVVNKYKASQKPRRKGRSKGEGVSGE